MTKRRSIPDAAVPDGRFKRWACDSAENAGPEYTGQKNAVSENEKS